MQLYVLVARIIAGDLTSQALLAYSLAEKDIQDDATLSAPPRVHACNTSQALHFSAHWCMVYM